MSAPYRIAGISRAMSWLAIAGAVVLPILIVATFIYPDQTRFLNLGLNHLGAPLADHVPLQWRLVALLIEAIPIGIAIWGLLALHRLFRLFADGKIFSPAALTAFKTVTASVFWYVLAAFLSEAPLSLALTAANPPGQHVISFGLGLGDVAVLFLGGATLVIGRVMAEAARLAEENESIV